MTEIIIPDEPQHIAMFKEFIQSQCDLPEIVVSLQTVLFQGYDTMMERSVGAGDLADAYYVTHSLLQTLTKMSILYMQNKG